MVSQISSRLFADYASSHSSDGSRNSQASQTNSKRSSAGTSKKAASSTGYAADIDRIVKKVKTPLPSTIDLSYSRTSLGKGKREGSTASSTGDANEAVGKRRKMQEMNYLAATARSDLARGGLHVPTIRVQCPRTFPALSGVDMTTVKLMYSKDFDSPFLTPEVEEDKDTPQYLNSDTDRMQAFVDLAKACQYMYALPTNVVSESAKAASSPSAADDAESSTSSVTDPDSEDSNAVRKSDRKKRHCTLMTMSEALSICTQPRCVYSDW
jgi:hypothetical protein